jgi:hypothetical protein
MDLAMAFTAVNDNVNALATFQSVRPMKKGVAVLASDLTEADAKGATDPEKTEQKTERYKSLGGIPNVECKAEVIDEQDETKERNEDEKGTRKKTTTFGISTTVLYARLTTLIMPSSVVWAAHISARAAMPCSLGTRSHFVFATWHTSTWKYRFWRQFKEGELLVEGKVMTLEEWKMSIEKSWNL